MSATTIVVPCYNEELRLDGAAFVEACRIDPALRFLFVNDGSRDGTGRLLEALTRQNAELTLLDLPRNGGKAEAVRRGMLQACDDGARFAGFWDADLATPLNAIDALRRVLLADERRLMALGARVQLMGRRIERQAHRHYLGRVFATLASTILDLKVYDTQCGSKLFRVTPEIRELFVTPFLTDWEFDVELLARFCSGRRRSNGPGPEGAIYEYPLETWLHRQGSKVGPSAYLGALVQLVRIARAYRPRDRAHLGFPSAG